MGIVPRRSTVPQPMLQRVPVLTSDMAELAAKLVKRAQPYDLSLHRAVDRAVPRLITMPWRIINGGILEIASASHHGEVHQTDGAWCTCDSVYRCWHMAAWWMISTVAAAMCSEVVAVLPLPDMVEVDAWAGLQATVLHPEPGTPYAMVIALVDELF